MDSLRLPTTIRHYQIVRRLGAGGMGEVYLASDTQLHRQVAIKFLTTNRTSPAPILRQRMLREARAATALDYPNICVLLCARTSERRRYWCERCSKARSAKASPFM